MMFMLNEGTALCWFIVETKEGTGIGNLDYVEDE
jgi:hypothetical protein